MLTGAEKEKRVIVGGYSPAVHSLPKAFLKSAPVIGINKWPHFYACDYWIALDTFRWHEWEPWLRRLDAIKVLRKRHMGDPKESLIPENAADYWFNQAEGIPTEWNETLRWESSTALAAISLAIVLGAQEVVLYGVDFVGGQRADGSTYTREDHWLRHKEPINNLLREFQNYITVYKTHPDSFLDCPLMEI